MPDGWSRPLDIERLADRHERIEFSVPLAQLPRVQPMLAQREGEATGSVRFSRERGCAIADVQVRATVVLTCQRCLGPLRWPIDAEARVALAAGAAYAERVPRDLETVMAPEGRITVAELAEEEILLGLPVVPLHADAADCRASGASPAAGSDDDGIDVTQKPFAELAELLKRGS
jgi:uncharacterized protein